MMNLPLYCQWDIRWGNQLMHPSKYALKTDGCYTTAIAMRLANSGINVTPGELCTKLSGNGGYLNNGLITYDGIVRAFPQMMFYERVYTTNDPSPNIQKTLTEVAIANIMSLMKLGQPVILCVDNVGNDGWPDHAVLLVDTDWTIHDPAGGLKMKFQDKYGDPMKKLYGYVSLLGPCLTFPDVGYPDAGQALSSLVLAVKGQGITYNTKAALQQLSRIK